MKYCCDILGLEDNFIELSDSWSRKEVLNFWQFKGVDYLALLQKKLISCHLTRVGDAPLTEPIAFTEEGSESLDWRVWRWAVNIPAGHVRALGELGEVSGLRSFVSTETNLEPTSDAQEK